MSVAMETVERCVQSDDIKNPEDLVKNLRIFCRKNNFEMESLEMRNDVYVISVRRPVNQKLKSSR